VLVLVLVLVPPAQRQSRKAQNNRQGAKTAKNAKEGAGKREIARTLQVRSREQRAITI
jgi:hypothetical protein